MSIEQLPVFSTRRKTIHMESRICRDCGIELNGNNQTRHLARNQDLWCSTCERTYWTRKRSEGRVWAKQHPEESRRYKREDYLKHFSSIREYHLRRKMEALDHYSNGTGTCAMCGYSNIKALSLDHIDGSGAEKRREGKEPSGSSFYAWLRRNGWPIGLQVLCMNCQFIKRWDDGEHLRVSRVNINE